MPWRAVGRSRRRNQQPSHNNCGRWYSFSVRSSTLPSDLGVLRASSSVRQRCPLPALAGFLGFQTLRNIALQHNLFRKLLLLYQQSVASVH